MTDAEFPEELVLRVKRAEVLRYGENAHQGGALYLDPNDKRPGVATARRLQGKELSYNNLQDADAAFECVAEFDEPACVIVKHMNPCGVAVGECARVRQGVGFWRYRRAQLEAHRSARDGIGADISGSHYRAGCGRRCARYSFRQAECPRTPYRDHAESHRRAADRTLHRGRVPCAGR